jgi:prefoldin subunit 5
MTTQSMPSDVKEIEALERRVKDLDEQLRVVNDYLHELEQHMKSLK